MFSIKTYRFRLLVDVLISCLAQKKSTFNKIILPHTGFSYFRMNQINKIQFLTNESFPHNNLSHFNSGGKTIIMTRHNIIHKFKEYIKILLLESRLPVGHYSFFSRRWSTLPPNLHLQKINKEQMYFIIIKSPDNRVTTQINFDDIVTTFAFFKSLI